MNLVVISDSENHQNEITLIHNLFESGLKKFHIRKPDFTQDEIIDYIESIDEKWHNRLMLHSHHYLVSEYNLKGMHYKSNNLGFKSNKMDEFTHSASCHSFKEMDDAFDLNIDYVFLSPVFKSISKSNYSPVLKQWEIKDYLKKERSTEILALGGIHMGNIEECYELGFDGVALLGDIWKSPNPIQSFNNVLKKCRELEKAY